MHHSSIPEMVMTTGSLAPFSPYQARQDVSEAHVAYVTRVPVGLQPGEAQYSPPPSALVVSSAADPKRTMLPDGSVSLAGFEGDEIVLLGLDSSNWKLYALATIGTAVVFGAGGAAFSRPGNRVRFGAKSAAFGAAVGALTAALMTVKG